MLGNIQEINNKDKDTLTFITCGSVDDGKSTLIGRFLNDNEFLFTDQITKLKTENKRKGNQFADIDYALLLDGLSSEREQGITIDVSYRYFSTKHRKFIVADTPGHFEYTRNMATACSNAELAIILVDARKGLLEQTFRHSIICSLMGVKNIILAVNKMDLVNYSEIRFKEIILKFQKFAETQNFQLIDHIPISALKGDNVVFKSPNLSWYEGPSLMSILNLIKILPDESKFRMPVQLVNRPNMDFRSYSGYISNGKLQVNDTIRVIPTNQRTKIKEIFIGQKSIISVGRGISVSLTTKDELSISRGDCLIHDDDKIEVSDQFNTTLIWLTNTKGFSGREYILKHTTQKCTCVISAIKSKLDILTGNALAVNEIFLNDICKVNIKTAKPIWFDSYNQNKHLGGFILIDKLTKNTLAAGMINFALKRSKNIIYQKLYVDKDARRKLNGHSSKVLWLTGLSGSGKTTIANELCKSLHNDGIRSFILDGDNLRHGLNFDLGFTDADRIENIRRVSHVAKLMVDAGIYVITSFISPFKSERDFARQLFNKHEFTEIFVDTPIEVCEKRDIKGLYKKAREGQIPNFTGIDSPYEKPLSPEIKVSTVNSSLEDIVKLIRKKVID